MSIFAYIHRRDWRVAGPLIGLGLVLILVGLLQGCAAGPKEQMRELVVAEQIAAQRANTVALQDVPSDFYQEATLTITVHLCGPGRFADELKKRGVAPNSMAGFLEHGRGDHIWIQGGPAYGDLYIPPRDLGHEMNHALRYKWGLPSSREDHLYE